MRDKKRRLIIRVALSVIGFSILCTASSILTRFLFGENAPQNADTIGVIIAIVLTMIIAFVALSNDKELKEKEKELSKDSES